MENTENKIAEIQLILTENSNGIRTLKTTSFGDLEDFAEIAKILSENKIHIKPIIKYIKHIFTFSYFKLFFDSKFKAEEIFLLITSSIKHIPPFRHINTSF